MFRLINKVVLVFYYLAFLRTQAPSVVTEPQDVHLKQSSSSWLASLWLEHNLRLPEVMVLHTLSKDDRSGQNWWLA